MGDLKIKPLAGENGEGAKVSKKSYVAAEDNAKTGTEQALAFLKKHTTGWDPEWFVQVVAIDPETEAIDDRAEHPEQLDKLTLWLLKRYGVKNIYFAVNPLKHDPKKKCSREDMAALAYAHIDLDPPKVKLTPDELAAKKVDLLGVVDGFTPAPSEVVDTGNGIAAYWCLAEPVPCDGVTEADALADTNRRLAQALSGDSATDISRLMRLPGTVNLPTAAKAEFARPVSQARVLEWNATAYSLDDFADLPQAAAAVKNVLPPTSVGTAIPLKQYRNLTDQQQLLVKGELPKGTRSEVMHSLLVRLLNDGHHRDNVLATIYKEPGLWAYIADKHPGDAEAFALAELSSAWTDSAVVGVIEAGKKIAEALEAKAPPSDRQPLAELMEAKARGFEAPYLAALWSEDVTPDWLIDNVLENMAITEIWGPSQAFKSFVAIDMSTAITSGQDWHGNPTRRQGEVLYIPGEGRRNIVRRIRGACQKRGLGRDQKIRVANMPCRLSVFEQYKWLREYIADLPAPPILIVIDTLARNYGGNENSAEDMGRFTDHLGDLIREFRCAVLLIHHCGRDGKHARGSYALDAGVDAEYEAVADNDPQRRSLLLVNHKMKDGESGKKFAFNMKLITLKDDNGNDLQKDGQPVDTLVLESGASVHALEQAEFFKDHPEFRSKGKSLIEQRLPLVLRYAYASPGMGARAMAGVVTPTLRDHSWAANMHKLMVDADLVEGDGFTLTEAGKQAAIVFDCRARFVEAGKDLPATPTLTVEKVARSAQLL